VIRSIIIIDAQPSAVSHGYSYLMVLSILMMAARTALEHLLVVSNQVEKLYS
jgi:hypothetical protein